MEIGFQIVGVQEQNHQKVVYVIQKPVFIAIIPQDGVLVSQTLLASGQQSAQVVEGLVKMSIDAIQCIQQIALVEDLEVG